MDASRSAASRSSSAVLRCDRDPHQPDDHVAEVHRLAAALARLRLLELGDQRPHRRHCAEALEAAAQAGELRRADCG